MIKKVCARTVRPTWDWKWLLHSLPDLLKRSGHTLQWRKRTSTWTLGLGARPSGQLALNVANPWQRMPSFAWNAVPSWLTMPGVLNVVKSSSLEQSSVPSVDINWQNKNRLLGLALWLMTLFNVRMFGCLFIQ